MRVSGSDARERGNRQWKARQLPRVTFGMIVLNGEPFLRYNLRAIYPFAHQIIVVEGAAPAAAAIATPDGHSTDGTLGTLHEFKAHEDPQDKLTIVIAEDDGHPNGFWPGEKDEQSQAYARRATGDYLWQVDVDEFYRPDDVRTVLRLLSGGQSVDAVSFKQLQFWGGFRYYTDSYYLRWQLDQVHRVFRWGPTYSYVAHRPPTVRDSQGRDLRTLRWLDGYELADQGIFMYHYSLVFPKQVFEKCEYYGTATWAGRAKAQQWAEDVFLKLQRPYRVHNVYDYLSWLERFEGEHPPQIEALRADIRSGKLTIDVRPTDDIERLLQSSMYRLGRAGLKLLDPVARRLSPWWRRAMSLVNDPLGSVRKLRRKAARFLGQRP